jgi:ankyrin repeat protein
MILAATGNHIAAAALLSFNPDPNFVIPDNNIALTALHFAVIYNQPTMVTLLLQHGANITAAAKLSLGDVFALTENDGDLENAKRSQEYLWKHYQNQSELSLSPLELANCLMRTDCAEAITKWSHQTEVKKSHTQLRNPGSRN